MNVLRRSEQSHRQLKSRNGESYSLSAILSDALNSKDFFIHHEILQPGHRSSDAHFHAETEEVIYILKGQLTAHEENQSVTLSVGDSICFHMNSTKFHFLSNHGEEAAEFLVINRKLQSPDIVFSKTE